MRTVAEFDYERALVVSTWPLVEVLHAYMHHARIRALADYRLAATLYATLRNPKATPPRLPSILG